MPSTVFAPRRSADVGIRGVVTALLVATLAGCWVPDRPPRLGASIPTPALEWLAPDTARGAPLAPGAWYRYVWSAKGPWAVHLVEVELAHCALTLDVVRALAQEGDAPRRERVTSMVRRQSGRVLAAVNGDFFTPEGTPLGLEVVQDTPTHRASRPGLAWRDGAAPVMGPLSLADGVVEGAGWRLGAGGEVDVVGGFPELLDDGDRVGDLEVEARPTFAASRNPRTAVAFDVDANRLWIVVVDGRQGAYSTGMTLPELTTLLEGLGADEALNLDGGDSSAMVVAGRLVSRPSDEEGERGVANALLLRYDPSRCPG